MCGQSCVYNTYATPPTPNLLFSGFLSYQSVNKEIISLRGLYYTSGLLFWSVFYDNCGKITYSENIYMQGRDNYDSTKKDKTYGRENGKRKFGVPHVFDVQCR